MKTLPDLKLIGQFSPSVYPQYLDRLQEEGISVHVDDSGSMDLRGRLLTVVTLFVPKEDYGKAMDILFKEEGE